MGAIAGAVFAINHLESGSETWRRIHPVAKIPLEWMPTVCPVDPSIDGLCQSSDRGLQVLITTTLASFLIVFMTLLVKTPQFAPSKINFVNYAVVAGAVYAFIGCSHLLGGGINPAANFAVIWAYDMQLTTSQTWGPHNTRKYLWLYILSPLVGGYAAGYANRLHILVLSKPGPDSTPKVQAVNSPSTKLMTPQSKANRKKELEQELLVITTPQP